MAARVVVMGVSGCGKSAVADGLGAALGVSVVDGDHLHTLEAVATMRAGTPLTDEDRRPWLAALNAELCDRAALGQRVVLACSALRQRYRDSLAANVPAVHWIFLDGSVEEIAARMRARDDDYLHPFPQLNLGSCRVLHLDGHQSDAALHYARSDLFERRVVGLRDVLDHWAARARTGPG